MILNGFKLFMAEPITDMLHEKEQAHGVSHGLSDAGYDIRLKQEVIFMERVHNKTLQMCNYVGEDPEHPYSGKPGRPRGRPRTWKPGRFALASAVEHFTMPDNLVGIVHDKSTWARQGLSVFNTVIEPGWHGYLTLELVYHGTERLVLPAGAGIAQVIFHDLTQRAAYAGKYQNQEDRPVDSIFRSEAA